MSLWVKICGVTSVEAALMIEQAGADAIGLNFASVSPRCIGIELAREIADAVRGKLEIVGVFVDSDLGEIRHVTESVGLDTVQLHGAESPAFLQELNELVSAYKALRIGDAQDVAASASYGSDRILVDAKVAGALGGTGRTFDWNLITGLNEERKLILAGGLNPENVERSVREVQPYGIDTASGVERSPGTKDEKLVRAFVTGARRGYRRSRSNSSGP